MSSFNALPGFGQRLFPGRMRAPIDPIERCVARGHT